MMMSDRLAPRSWANMPAGAGLVSRIVRDFRRTRAALRCAVMTRMMQHKERCSVTDTSLFRKSNRHAKALDQAIEELETSSSHYRPLVEGQGSWAQSD